MPADLKFPECHSCAWFLDRRCFQCGAGEFFEQEIDDEEPSDLDVMEMQGGWRDDDGE